MPDGVVTTAQWTQIEAYLVETEKAGKGKPPLDEQRIALQEILSEAPPHSISFMLVTTMLERIGQEVAGVMKADEQPPLSPSKRPAGGTLRRMTGSLGKLPPTPVKEQATSALAHVLADAVVRVPVVSVEKVKAAVERRRDEFVEMFLRRDGEG